MNTYQHHQLKMCMNAGLCQLLTICLLIWWRMKRDTFYSPIHWAMSPPCTQIKWGVLREHWAPFSLRPAHHLVLTTCSNSCILHHSVPYGPHHRHISYLQEYSHFLAQKVLQATQLYCILTSTVRLNTKCLTPETETSQISPVMPGMSAVYWQFLRCPWPTTM